MRIDKFLWCVRLFKTRRLATDACRKGHVMLDQRPVKAAAVLKAGQLVAVRQPPIWRVFEVRSLPASRVAAKLVPDLITDRTSWEDLEKLERSRAMRADTGTYEEGRPTKRERRDLDRFMGS